MFYIKNIGNILELEICYKENNASKRNYCTRYKKDQVICLNHHYL